MLGKEHPLTLKSMGNLAAVLSRGGQYEEAEQMQRQALEGREKVLGEEHADTLATINNPALLPRKNKGSAKDDPRPEGWEKRKTQDRRVYFADHNTKSPSWFRAFVKRWRGMRGATDS